MANFWFALDVGAYNKKTAHLTLLEHGVYFALMRHYYATESALPTDAAQLQRICRAHSVDELEAIPSVLSQFFSIKNGAYHNARCDEELRLRRQIAKKYKVRAKLAATKRWSKRSATSIPVVELRAQDVTDTVTYTNTKEKTSSTAEIGIDAATQKVFIELLLAGNEARMLCHDAVNAYVHGNKCTFEVAADSLIALWQEYDSTVKEFKRGVFKFFKEGLWRSPESWRVNGESRRNTQARKDLTAEADPDCEKCCGSGYDAKDRKVCNCTERALAKGAN